MKKKVELSAYSIVISAFGMSILCFVLCLQVSRDVLNWLSWTIFGVIISLCFCVLFYSPLSLSLSDSALSVNRLLRVRRIPLSEIESVRLCPPTMGAKRIFGSGGWFGYYGWFSEGDLGKYFAYYGKSSDCFLVTLKNGMKYMLGCKDAPEMVEAIRKWLK